jgi:transcriptional regulator with XRE-family HTH domain
MKVMADVQLKTIRESIGLPLEELARRAGVSSRTVRNAEYGQKISFNSAVQILQGLNSALADIGKPALTMSDVGINF